MLNTLLSGHREKNASSACAAWATNILKRHFDAGLLRAPTDQKHQLTIKTILHTLKCQQYQQQNTDQHPIKQEATISHHIIKHYLHKFVGENDEGTQGYTFISCTKWAWSERVRLKIDERIFYCEKRVCKLIGWWKAFTISTNIASITIQNS